MHWHKYEPPGCAATTSRPRKECHGPELLPNRSLWQCIDNRTAQRACEEREECAGLYFDGKACRMLRCSDSSGTRSSGARSHDCKQRFVAKSVHPRERAALLDGMTGRSCSAVSYVMRHLRSHVSLSFSRTPARYFTIVESGGGTWLVWKNGVIHGELRFAQLEGADAARPMLRRDENQTLLERLFEANQRGYLMTHNAALLMYDGRLHVIGGRHMGDEKNSMEDGVYHVSADSAALSAAARDRSSVDLMAWSSPRRIFDGRHQGCIDGRVNSNGMSPFIRHGVCEYDGRFSLIFFRGRFLHYVRANPTLGRRFVQVTSSADLQEWTAMRSIRLKSTDACAANIYTFAVQHHPLRTDRLLAFYPSILGCHSGSSVAEGPRLSSWSGVHCTSAQRRFPRSGSGPGAGDFASVDDLSSLANASLMISCSANGRSWSQPFPLFHCRVRRHSGVRIASLPVSNGLRLMGDKLFVWVHQDVPLDRRLRDAEDSQVVRYELTASAFHRWSAEACGSALEATTDAREGAHEALTAQRYNASPLMDSIAKLWYINRKQVKVLQASSTGWCGGRLPIAPWARDTPEAQMSVADCSNDELFFNESWYAGLPVSLKGRGIEYSTEEGLVKRNVRMDRDRQRQSAGHTLGGSNST